MKWISKIFFFLTSLILITKEIISFCWGWWHYVYQYDGWYDMGWWYFNSPFGIVQWGFWQLFLVCFFIATATNLFTKKH